MNGRDIASHEKGHSIYITRRRVTFCYGSVPIYADAGHPGQSRRLSGRSDERVRLLGLHGGVPGRRG